MPPRWLGGARRLPAALAAAVLLGGCAVDVGTEMDRASQIARFATRYDHPIDPQNNLLDRALAGCAEKTAKAETACVRDAVAAGRPSVQGLMGLVPGCRGGQVCHYDHATRDRLGFVEANATDYNKRWRVDLDFRRPAADAGQVPVTVLDLDDFDAVAPPAGRG